jgi:hypothetical protein
MPLVRATLSTLMLMITTTTNPGAQMTSPAMSASQTLTMAMMIASLKIQ